MVYHTTIVTEVIFHQKIVKENGDIVEMRILQVAESGPHPEGIRYALAYIHNGKRVIGFDNFEGKGHHKHSEGKEQSYDFRDIDTLIKDFQEEVEQWKSKK